MFLELDAHPCHLGIKLPDKSNNVIIPKTFYLQKTLNINDNDSSKIYTNLNPTALQEPQAYCLKKLKYRHICLMKFETEKLAKKDETN